MYPPDHVANYPGDGYTPEDDGTMPKNVAELEEAVIGRRIVSAEKTGINPDDFEPFGDSYSVGSIGLVLTLDDGRRVLLADTSDCCANTYLKKFLLHPERVDHAITGVASTEGYTKWHIFADLGDILELDVEWSSGNPFYYGYGFDLAVSTTIEGSVLQHQLGDGR